MGVWNEALFLSGVWGSGYKVVWGISASDVHWSIGRISMQDTKASHYGTKPGHFETLKIHFPTSEGVSEVSERANS